LAKLFRRFDYHTPKALNYLASQTHFSGMSNCWRPYSDCEM